MTHSIARDRDFPSNFHTAKANTLADQYFAGTLSWENYLSRTVPVLVACQPPNKMMSCIPVVLGFSEFLEGLTRYLLGIFNLKQREATLRVKWGGPGALPFDLDDTLLLDTKNLEPTVRLLKQRQGTDMILLEVRGSSLVGRAGPSGDQKGSKREGKKKQEGRKAVEKETERYQRHSSHSDVAMEEL